MGRSRGCIIRKNTKELRESLMSLRYRWLVEEERKKKKRKKKKELIA